MEISYRDVKTDYRLERLFDEGKMVRRKRGVLERNIRSDTAALYPFCLICEREILPGEICLSNVSKMLKHTVYICKDCLREGWEQ